MNNNIIEYPIEAINLFATNLYSIRCDAAIFQYSRRSQFISKWFKQTHNTKEFLDKSFDRSTCLIDSNQ